jgi:hypothetical protein
MLSRCLLIITVVCSVCLGTASGQEALQQQTAAAETQKALEPNEKSPEAKPKISFEKTVHDFGELDIGQKGTCEFRFKNTGSGLLEIGSIKATCGCTVPTLAKKQYQPGEDGVIKIKYSGQSSPGAVTKSIYVNANDPENPKVKLMIKAKVVPHIEFSPSELCFSAWEENAAAPDITIKSKDGKAFAITGFTSTNNAISVEFDPSISTGEFVLKPKVDVQKLRKHPKGTIKIELSHPKQHSVDIPYETLSRFQALPGRLLVSKIKPGDSQTKQILIKNTNGELFEIDSISSKKGYVKVVSQQPSSEGIKLTVQVTAPEKKDRARYFSDDLEIKINSGETVTVRCNGFYSRDTDKS